MTSYVSVQITNPDGEAGRGGTAETVIFAALSLSAAQLESNE